MILWIIAIMALGLVCLSLSMIYNSLAVMRSNLNAFYNESYQDLQVPTFLKIKPTLVFIGYYVVLNLTTQFGTTILNESLYNSMNSVYEAGKWVWIFALIALLFFTLTGEVNIKLMGEKKFKRIQSLFIGFIIGFLGMWLLPVVMVGLAAVLKIFA